MGGYIQVHVVQLVAYTQNSQRRSAIIPQVRIRIILIIATVNCQVINSSPHPEQ